MSVKRALLAAVGAFVVIVAADTVIHNVWLGPFYHAHPTWWRSAADMQSMMGFMFGAQFALAALLALVYAKGYEDHKGGASQGFRFGVLMGLLLAGPKNLMLHAVYPYPVSLLANWFIGGFVETVLAGIVIGLLYRPSKS